MYGTYEERRSSLVVTVSRWTWAFLFLHNLSAMASYAAFVAGRAGKDVDIEVTTIVHRAIDEGVSEVWVGFGSSS